MKPETIYAKDKPTENPEHNQRSNKLKSICTVRNRKDDGKQNSQQGNRTANKVAKLNETNDKKYYKIEETERPKNISDPETWLVVQDKTNRSKSLKKSTTVENEKTNTNSRRSLKRVDFDAKCSKSEKRDVDLEEFESRYEDYNSHRNLGQERSKCNKERIVPVTPAVEKVDTGAQYSTSKFQKYISAYCNDHRPKTRDAEVYCSSVDVEKYNDDLYKCNSDNFGQKYEKQRPRSADRHIQSLIKSAKFDNDEQRRNFVTICKSTKRLSNRDSYSQYLDDMKQFTETYDARRKRIQSNKENWLRQNFIKEEEQESDESDHEGPSLYRKNSKVKWEIHSRKRSNFHKNCLAEVKSKPKVRQSKYVRKNIMSDTPEKKPSKKKKKKKKMKRFSNECYCMKNPKVPVIEFDGLTRYMRDYDFSHGGVARCYGEIGAGEVKKEKRLTRKAVGVVEYSPESKFLKKVKHEIEENDPEFPGKKEKQCLPVPLKYTKYRDIIEKAHKFLESDRRKLESYCGHECGHEEVLGRLRSGSDVRSQSERNWTVCGKIPAVNHIRHENFFETHSTADLIPSEDIPKHRCVFKYELDDRQLPKPLNPDVYGTNRCLICSKPVSHSTLSVNYDSYDQIDRNFPSQPKIFSRDSLNASNVYSKSSSSQCISPETKKTVVNKKTKDIVQIKIPDSFDKLLTTPQPIKFKPQIRPQNTCALRYQRGVL